MHTPVKVFSPGTSSKQSSFNTDSSLISISRAPSLKISGDAKATLNPSYIPLKKVRSRKANALGKRSRSNRDSLESPQSSFKGRVAVSSSATNHAYPSQVVQAFKEEEANERQQLMMDDMKPAFEIMQLNESDLRLIQESFRNIDVSQSGTIDIRELEAFLKIDRSPFNGRVLAMFDADKSGELDFFEYLLMVWNYCSMDNYNLAKFAFQLYNHDEHKKRRKDEYKVSSPAKGDKAAFNSSDFKSIEDMYDVYLSRDGGSVISTEQIRSLLQDVYGGGLEKNQQALSIVNGMPKGVYDLQGFVDFMKSHQSLLYPTFLFQQKLRHFVGGQWFWSRHTDVRNKFVEADFHSIISLMREAQDRYSGTAPIEENAVREVRQKALRRIHEIRAIAVKASRREKRTLLRLNFPAAFLVIDRATSVCRGASSSAVSALRAARRGADTIAGKAIPTSSRVDTIGAKALSSLSLAAKMCADRLREKLGKYVKSPFLALKLAPRVRSTSVTPLSDAPAAGASAAHSPAPSLRTPSRPRRAL